MAKKKERKVSNGANTTTAMEEGDAGRLLAVGGCDGGGSGVGDPTNELMAGDGGEIWDLVRVLEPHNNEGGTAGPKCRMEGCDKCAVVVWAELRQRDDEWPMCEQCQENEFGGWPVGVEVPPTSAAEKAEPAKEQDTKTIVTEEPTMDTGTSSEPEAEPEIEPEKDDGNDAPEVWDLKKILTVQEITDISTKCCTETCSLPAACVWVSNRAPTDEWFTCLDCQETDFGGFPPAEELPTPQLSPEILSAMAELCSRKSEPTLPSTTTGDSKTPGKKSKDTAFATITPAPNGEDDDDDEKMVDDEEDREIWDLKKIVSIESLLEFPVKCSTDTCSLLAACIWISNKAPTEKWYTCLDCQAKDFGGWPPVDELPLPHMTQEHLDLLAQKCSRQKSLEMPSFQTASPSHGNVDTATHLPAVTPVPGKQDYQDGEDGSDDPPDGGSLPNPPPKQKKPAQPSKQALELHRKWQEAAEAVGGKDARIIVSAPKAKKVIFELLEGSFRPMNITEIHKGLKATVPPPVLKACLDEMVDCSLGGNAFPDSDDELEEEKPKTYKGATASEPFERETGDPFKASLCFKGGKTSSSSLYYVDYSKLKNNGNGLDPQARNELVADLAKAQAEVSALGCMINQMTSEANKLLSEPTNEQAVSQLETEQAELDELMLKLEDARKLKVNEKHKAKVKQSIEIMTAQWRKRRRICMDFLVTMEEYTDGSVSMKKCLMGDGPIDIDSDEAVAKGAVAFAVKKRSAPALVKKLAPLSKKTKTVSSEESDSMASDSFVAVTLDSQGRVSRVFVDDEPKE